MDAHTSTTLEALERTAAWVQQVQVQVEMELRKSEEGMQGPENPSEEVNTCTIDEDVKLEVNSDKDDNSLTDHHDEALKIAQAFPPYVPKAKNGTNYAHIDIRQTVKEFKEALEKFGISQRFACSHVMENTSQGNLSFLLDKGKNKLWSEISPRGRIPYIRMRRWLDSPDEQKATLEMLHKSKDFRKGQKIGSETIMNKREKFSVFQLLVLCRVFEEDQNPSLSTRALLADKLEAPLERITIWFQNQRARGFPAKKLIRESNLAKESLDINFSELSPKKDQGMKKSNTPLSTGNATTSSSSPTLPLDYSRLNATVPSTANELQTSSYNALTAVLNSTASAAPSTSFAHLPQLPLQLLNMTHQIKAEQGAAAIGQTMAQFPGFLPHLYSSPQSNIVGNATTNNALNFLNMYQPITIKDEPKDSTEDKTHVTTS